MSYQFWRGGRTFEQREFHERVYRRQLLAAWDAKWHGLSPQARRIFLHEVKIPDKNLIGHAAPPSVSIDIFPPSILKELTDAGFVAVKREGGQTLADRVVARDASYEFASRIGTLRRFHLLATDWPGDIVKYVQHAFFTHQLTYVLENLLRKVGIESSHRLDEILRRYVSGHRWPGWVVESLNQPVAKRILDVVREAGQAIRLAELPGRIEETSPETVQALVNELMNFLVLFEDLHPETCELMVGLLPAVREKMIGVGKPRHRPDLVVCDRPREVGPARKCAHQRSSPYFWKSQAGHPVSGEASTCIRKRAGDFRPLWNRWRHGC